MAYIIEKNMSAKNVSPKRGNAESNALTIVFNPYTLEIVLNGLSTLNDLKLVILIVDEA